MEILNNIWNMLTTSNLELCNWLIAPFAFIEIWIGMLLFTTLLDLETTKKQRLIYFSVLTIWTIISNILIPKPFGLYLNMIMWPISIFIIFKTSVLKAIVATLIPLLFSIILESIIGKLFYLAFSLTYEMAVSIPIYRLCIVFLIYILTYILYLLAKKFRLHLTFKNLNVLKNSSARLFAVNFGLGILAIATQAYLMTYYANLLPFPIIVLSTISLLTYFTISIYSLIKTSQLETTSQRLEETQLYNKTLELLHDNIKAFKHDFSNIMQALAGYVDAEDINGLKRYFKDLNRDCMDTNNLNALSPKVINNPAIYSILASKYYKADQHGIKINLEIFLDLNTLHIKTYQFTRILGILLDNAIEASQNCKDKIINLAIRNDFKVKRQILIVENTYENKDVNVEKIFEKGFSSKPENTGLGLWEIRQILHKNRNLNLFTTHDETYFRQQLEIYPE